MREDTADLAHALDHSWCIVVETVTVSENIDRIDRIAVRRPNAAFPSGRSDLVRPLIQILGKRKQVRDIAAERIVPDDHFRRLIQPAIGDGLNLFLGDDLDCRDADSFMRVCCKARTTADRDGPIFYARRHSLKRVG